jgi:hypothetical protein
VKRLLGIGWLAWMLSSQAAAAVIIEPNEPQAGAEVQAVVYLSGTGTTTFCRHRDVNLDGEDHDISVDGNTIRLDLVMNPVAGVCVTIVPPTPHNFTLGPLAAGNYTLIVSEVGPETTFPVSDEERIPMASTVFGVTAAPIAIPVNRPLALALLAGLLLVAGMAFRRRRSNVA